MKRILNIVGSLFGFLVLVSLAVVLAMTFGGLRRGVQPASQVFQSPVSPVERPALPPDYILKKLTPPPILTIPPTVTRPPKPLPSPTPTPTATPIPTPLPLPPSSFYALWAENFPEGQGSVLWLADPRDIGSRREVLRFDRDAIYEAALSPNGQKVALVSGYWKTSTVWVVNVDGSGLQMIDYGGGPLLWSHDNRLLTYGVAWPKEVMMPSYKDGTPAPVTVWEGAIMLVEVATGKKWRLLEINYDVSLSPIGWSADGRELYYAYDAKGEKGYEYQLWAISPEGKEAHKILTLGNEPVPLTLSPDGSKFLLNTPEGRAWISIDGRTRQDIPVPPWRQQCGLTWSINKDELILCEVDEKEPIEHIKVLNLQTGEKRVLVSFRFPSNHTPFSPIAVSPDMQWMAAGTYWMTAGTYYVKDYWIHIPTGMLVPVPCPPDGYCFFVAWVPRMKAGR
jgi:hypothetical protein